MPLRTIEQACTPRPSVFDPSIRDTVYSIDDLDRIDPRQFFAENFVTEGMRLLLTEAFKRLERRSENAPGTFLLSQSMGGGKTHNLLALGLLARNPSLRRPVMGEFHDPGPLGAVQVLTFSGRKTYTPFGLWGELAEQLNRREVFRDFYSPLVPPGDGDWVKLLRGDPILVLLDELPPYFQAAQAIPVGATTLDTITTTALANLLVAVNSGKLPNVCVVLTDLRSSAYSMGSAAVNEALRNLEMEVSRSVVRVDPVRLNTNELYQILRTRLFEALPEQADREAVADAYAEAVNAARLMDLTTAQPEQVREDIVNSYPFHPAIRDLYARFRENTGFQQTRALLRIMRLVVADLWQSGKARRQHLIGAHDVDLHHRDMLSEIRQINATLDNAIAHDLASEGRSSVAEQIDGPDRSDAQDAAKLIFLSSLSQAVNPILGLTRSEIVSYLAAPGRDLSLLNRAIDGLQSQSGAWYLHPTAGGALLFRNVENLVAKLDTFTRGYLRDIREAELRDQLKEMFKPKIGACYQEVQCLPPLDQVTPTQDRVTLVVFRPSATALADVQQFFDHQQYKNRLLFLSGPAPAYEQVLQRSAELRAIRAIINEFQQEGRKETDPQFQEARTLESKAASNFYLACRETFQTLYYPTRRGLTSLELDPKYVANSYEGEQQIVEALKEAYKYTDDTGVNSSFPNSVENKLWPAEQKEVAWSEIKRRAATDPSWVWHHPTALDDLKQEMIRQDRWRDLGKGFIQRGPFPEPETSVLVQMQQRDDDTGTATLKVTPLHADTVYMSKVGVATQASERLDRYSFETTDLTLSFLAVDSTGRHATGSPVTWRNSINVRYRFFQEASQRMCELRAIPKGEIRYTVDGSSPDTSGLDYARPFPVPADCRVILAVARAEGITSDLLRVDVPKRVGEGGGDDDIVIVDPSKPATWKRAHRRESTGETYKWLELAVKHRAQPGGVKLVVGTDDNTWVELMTGARVFQSAEQVRAQADLLAGIIPGGNLSLEVEQLEFERGQDLIDLVAALRTTLKPGEVIQ